MTNDLSSSSKDNTNSKANMNSKAAYFLLISLLAALYWGLSPYVDRLTNQRSEIRALTRQIDTLNIESARQKVIETEHWDKLKSLYQNGDIYSTNAPLEASKKLQTTLKTAAKISNAKILQINPNQNLNPNQNKSASTHYETTLEANLIVQSDKLDDFLVALNSAVPKPKVSSLSLRPSGSLRQSDSASMQLSMQLTLVQHVVTNPDNFKDIVVNKTSFKHEKQIGLESIFSQASRKRMRTPSLDYYRLGAITLSPDSNSILLSDKHTGKSVKLFEGETLESWKLEVITEKEAIFSRNDKKYTLELK